MVSIGSEVVQYGMIAGLRDQEPEHVKRLSIPRIKRSGLERSRQQSATAKRQITGIPYHAIWLGRDAGL